MSDTFEYNGRKVERKAQPIQVSGTAYYTKVLQPDKGGKVGRSIINPSYSICLVFDEEYRPLLEGLGVVIRNDPDDNKPNSKVPGPYIQPRVYVDKIAPEGQKGQKAPRLLDADNRPFNQLVGNESKVDVLFYAIPDQYGILNTVRVQEHVAYEGTSLGGDLAGISYDLMEQENQTSPDQEEIDVASSVEDTDDAPNDEIPF